MSATIPTNTQYYDEWVRPQIRAIINLFIESINETPGLTTEQRNTLIATLNDKIRLNPFIKG